MRTDRTETITEEEAVSLLQKHATDKRSFNIVIAHCRAVAELAIDLAMAAGKNKDEIDFIKTAALLHDIGRFKCPPGKESVRHGIIGAEILAKEGLGRKYQKVCERHLGGGISAEDVRKQRLPLPEKDYIPLTDAEKIICYADKLIAGNQQIPFEETYIRFEKQIGKDAAERIKELHHEIKKMIDSARIKNENKKTGYIQEKKI